MGFDPRQVDKMSVWEFAACTEGVARANGSKPPEAADVSDDQLRSMGIKGFD